MAPLSILETSSSERDIVGEENRYSFQELLRTDTGVRSTLNLALLLEHDTQEVEASVISESLSLDREARSSFSCKDDLEVTNLGRLEEQIQVQKAALFGSRMQGLAIEGTRSGEGTNPQVVPFWKSNLATPSQVGTSSISKPFFRPLSKGLQARSLVATVRELSKFVVFISSTSMFFPYRLLFQCLS